MSVELNHTIVWCRDKAKSASFFHEILGLSAPRRFGPFLIVDLSNGVSLDFYEVEEKIRLQHYAFLISESEFDQIFGRIRERGLEYWADPHKEQPDGHFLEIITRPYGSEDEI